MCDQLIYAYPPKEGGVFNSSSIGSVIQEMMNGLFSSYTSISFMLLVDSISHFSADTHGLGCRITLAVMYPDDS